MKRVRLFSALFAAIIIVFSNVITIYAAPQTMSDGYIFDAEFYATSYPDVAAVFGTDANILYAHYTLFGIKEGRLPYAGAVAKKSNVTENLAEARIVYAQNEYIVKVIDYLNTLVNDSMSEREVVTVLHDDICNHSSPSYEFQEYLKTANPADINSVLAVSKKLTGGYILEDFETYKNGQARYACGGYKYNFEVMCLLCGIRVRHATCTINGAGHVWNRVMLDGVWYDVDVCWDDSLSTKEYFLVPAGTGVFADRKVGRYGVSEEYLSVYGSLIGQDWTLYPTPDDVIYNRFDPEFLTFKSSSTSNCFY